LVVAKMVGMVGAEVEAVVEMVEMARAHRRM